MAVVRFQKSSSFWLASFFTILLTFSVGIILYFISLSHDADLVSQTETEINADIQMFKELEKLGGQDNILAIITNRISEKQDRYFYNYPESNIKNVEWPQSAFTPKEGVVQFNSNQSTILAKILTFENGDELLVGRNIAYIKDTQNIISMLGVSIIVVLFIISAVAYFVSLYVVNLINTISNTADKIMKSGDLSQRIPLTHERDDLSKLARLLNSMFERIEELLAGVRQVSDNIAHDLRTPLSRLRNKIEKFDGSAEEKQALMKEADTLINIFNALLRIARIEAGKETMRFQKLNIVTLVKDVVEFYEPLAEEKQQIIKLSLLESQIKGDKDLLFQALANLLDNAIKFSPKGGKIIISSIADNDFYRVKISDSGVGIVKEDRDKVFTRFYRAEASRNKAGHGLGLSLVKAVIEAHNGRIDILDSDIGLSITLSLPNIR